jgi:hypothetical protein
MDSKEAKMILEQTSKGKIFNTIDTALACKWVLEEIEELKEGLDGWIMEEMGK